MPPSPFVVGFQPAIAIPPRLIRRTDRLRQLMASARCLLQTNFGQFPTGAVNSDVVVILTALLCVVGLTAVTHCARSRRSSSNNPVATATNKGFKKKALKALPKLAYEDAVAAAVTARRGSVAGEEKIMVECAICLSKFGEKEEICVLPQCSHDFHVVCVDTWLGAHSSCPSCRRVLVVDTPSKLPPEPKQCRKCEAMEEASSSSGAAGDGSADFLA